MVIFINNLLSYVFPIAIAVNKICIQVAELCIGRVGSTPCSVYYH